MLLGETDDFPATQHNGAENHLLLWFDDGVQGPPICCCKGNITFSGGGIISMGASAANSLRWGG